MSSLLGARWGSSAGKAEGSSEYGVGFGSHTSAVGGTSSFTPPIKAEPLPALTLAASASTPALGSSTSGLRAAVAWEKQMESADQQQAQLFHLQNNLVKEQVSTLSRDVAGMRQEFRDTYGSAIQALDAQVVQNMKTMQLALDQLQQEHHHRMQSGLANLESQFSSHAREMQVGLDAERRERDAVHGQLQKQFGDHRDILAQERQARELHHAQVAEHLANEKMARESHAGSFGGIVTSLEQRLQAELGRLSGDHGSRHKETRDYIDDVLGRERGARDQKFGAIQEQLSQHHASVHDRLSKHDEHRQNLQAALDGLSRDSRNEMLRMSNEHSSKHSSLQDLLKQQASDHQNNHRGLSSSHDDQKRALEELDRSLRSEITKHKGDHSSAMQSALEELERGVRGDIARSAGEHAGKLSESKNDHRKALEGLDVAIRNEMSQLAAEHRSGIDGHRSDLGDQLQGLDAQLRAEMARMGDDHQRGLASHAGGHQDALESHKEELKNQLKATEAGIRAELAGHGDARDGHRQQLEELDKKLKQEVSRLEGDSDERHAGLRASISGHPRGMDPSALAEVEERVRREIAAHADDHSARGQAHQKQLEELDQRLKKQMAQLADDHAGAHGSMKELLAQHVGDSKGSTQSLLQDLDRELRREMKALAGNHQDAHAKMGDLLDDHKGSLERQLAGEKAARDDHKTAHMAALSDLDKDLRKEIARLAGDHSDGHGVLRDSLDQHRGALDKHLSAERAEREALRESLLAGSRDAHGSLRKELVQMTEDHQANHGRISNLLNDHKLEQKNGLQASLESLDKELRRELAKHSDEHKSGHSKLRELFDEHKTGLEKTLVGERAARDEHKTAHQAQVQELDRQVRREIARLGDEHDANHSTIKGALGEHRSNLDRQLGAEKAAREDHRSGLLKILESLDKELRGEMQKAADVHHGNHAKLHKALEESRSEAKGHATSGLEALDAEVRKQMARLGEDAHGKHSGALHGLQELDGALRAEMRRLGDDHQGHKKELTSSNARNQTNQAKVQDLMSSHKADLSREMMTHNESLREMLAQEKAERYRLHNSMQERIDIVETSIVREDEDLRERLRTQLARQSHPVSVSRPELDEELQRLWQAMDSHTHNVVEEREELQPKAIIPTRIQVVEQESLQPVMRHATTVMAAAPPLIHSGSRSFILPATPSLLTPTSGRPMPNSSRSLSAGPLAAGPMAQARVLHAPATSMITSSVSQVPMEPLAMQMHPSGGM